MCRENLFTPNVEFSDFDVCVVPSALASCDCVVPLTRCRRKIAGRARNTAIVSLPSLFHRLLSGQNSTHFGSYLSSLSSELVRSYSTLTLVRKLSTPTTGPRVAISRFENSSSSSRPSHRRAMSIQHLVSIRIDDRDICRRKIFDRATYQSRDRGRLVLTQASTLQLKGYRCLCGLGSVQKHRISWHHKVYPRTFDIAQSSDRALQFPFKRTLIVHLLIELGLSPGALIE